MAKRAGSSKRPRQKRGTAAWQPPKLRPQLLAAYRTLAGCDGGRAADAGYILPRSAAQILKTSGLPVNSYRSLVAHGVLVNQGGERRVGEPARWLLRKLPGEPTSTATASGHRGTNRRSPSPDDFRAKALAATESEITVHTANIARLDVRIDENQTALAKSKEGKRLEEMALETARMIMAKLEAL